MSSSSDLESSEDIPFLLTPAKAYAGIVDFCTSGGRKLYEQATAKLNEELYDCTPGGLFQFLKDLEDRARKSGWAGEDGILMIPEDPANPDTTYANQLTKYGQITLERIKAFEETYIHG